MPISLSAKKSLRKSNKNRKHNSYWRKKFREASKKFLTKPSFKDLPKMFSILDKMGKAGLIHANKIARLKSKFNEKTKRSEAKAETKVKTTKKKNEKVVK